MELFRISNIFDKEIDYEKISQSTIFEDILNNNLQINEYSENIQRLFFLFVVLKEGGIPRKNSGTYSWKKQMFTIYRNIDFHEFLATDNEYALHLLALTFLEGIEQHLLKRKDFDGKRFYADVERLFEPYLMMVEV